MRYLSVDGIEVISNNGPIDNQSDPHCPNEGELKKSLGEQRMKSSKKIKKIIVLRNKGVEAVNVKMMEYRKNFDLFEISIDSFIQRSTPEDMARFAISLIKLSPFMKENIMISLSEDYPSNRHMNDKEMKNIIRMCIQKGFGWVEIVPDLDRSIIIGVRDETVRTGTKILLRYDMAVKDIIDMENTIWSADGIKIISNVSNIFDIQKIFSNIQKIRDIAPSIPLFLKYKGEYSTLLESLSPIMDIDGLFIDEMIVLTDPLEENLKIVRPFFQASLIERHLGRLFDYDPDRSFKKERKLSSNTRFYLFAGKPIKQSMEVILHNHCFELTDIDAISIPLETGSGSLDGLFGIARDLNVNGISLTMPLKKLMAKKLNSLDSVSKKIESVNAIKIRNEGPMGYNTEYHAMQEVLKKYVKDPLSRIMILGTGGAGKAFATASNDIGFKTFICGAMHERVLSIAKDIGQNVGAVSLRAVPRLKGRIDFLINATPEGTKMIETSNNARIGINEIALMLEPHFGLDLIYSPPWTPFLSIIESRGGVPISGLEVLIHQVINTHLIWTGRMVEYSDIRNIAMQAHPNLLMD